MYKHIHVCIYNIRIAVVEEKCRSAEVTAMESAAAVDITV